MRSIKDEPASSHSQADKSRKIHEDPLTHIKQKEYEQRKLLFKKTQIKQSDAVSVSEYYIMFMYLSPYFSYVCSCMYLHAP